MHMVFICGDSHRLQRTHKLMGCNMVFNTNSFTNDSFTNVGNSGIQKSHGGQALFSPVSFYQETPQTEARSSILTSRWRLYYMCLSRCAVLESRHQACAFVSTI